MTGNYTIVL